MRIADSMRYMQANRHLTSVRSQLAKASHQALTGQRLTAPSDDPLAAAELVQLSAKHNKLERQRKSAALVQGDAELAEGMLAEAGALMQSAIEAGLKGGSDQLGAEGRATLARELQGIRDQLLGIANTKGSRGYLFAGSKTETQPFDSTGAFLGDDAAHNVDVGAGAPVRVNASGQNAFTAAGGRDVFADLDATIAALNADDGAGVRAALDDLRLGHEQVQRERSQAGLVMNRLSTATLALDRSELLVARQSETLGAADQVRAYSDFVVLGQALERAIGVTQQLLSLNALNRS